jgi:hypothetical protein
MSGQNVGIGTISGTLTNGLSGDVVPNAVVVIESTTLTRQVRSGLDGTFSFAEVPFGSYHLVVRADGAFIKVDQIRELKERLASMCLPPVKGQGTSVLNSRISSRVYQLEANAQGIETLHWEIGKDKVRFTVRDSRGLHSIDCELGRWKDGETSMPGMPPKLTRGDLGPLSKVDASAAWQDPDGLSR